MAICKINLNQELNGIELLFDEKPSAETIASVKANGFRWSPKRKLWYAKQTSDRLTFAQNIGTIADVPTAARVIESFDLENLGDKTCIDCNLWGADLAKAIRTDLKKRGVNGCTVRAGKSTHTTTITVTVKADSSDFASLEECQERYTQSHFECDLQSHNDLFINGRWFTYNEYSALSDDDKVKAYIDYLITRIDKFNEFSRYHHDRHKDSWMLTTNFYNKLLAVYKIANQWNYDNSDSMTDYFDVGYYLDIDIKHDEIEPRATMTDLERDQLTAEREKEEADFKKWQAEQEENRRKAKEESEKYNAWVDESNELIFDNIRIEDLEESEQLFVIGLIGGMGKENSIDELKADIEEHEPRHESALITRKLIFSSSDAFERFSKMFLHDFPFIEGKGGTAAEDVRINETFDFFKLTKEQRESIDFFCNNCIAVYFGNELKYVIDSQGYSYARYVYLLADDYQVLSAPQKLEEMRKESENKTPFYFPAPVIEQIKNISVGDNISIWQCDGWLLNKVLDGFGTVTAIYEGSYAQYSGVYIELQQGRKVKKCFIRDNHDCLIYKTLNVVLPEEVTRKRINDHLSELYNCDVLIPNIYNYFKSMNILPVVDTWQR